MAYSIRLIELLERLHNLEEHFLPRKLKFPPTGQYTKQEEDQGRAYVLLVHAEIESYFEDRAKEVVDKAHANWKQTASCNKTLKRLLRWHLDSQKKYWQPIAQSKDNVDAAINSHKAAVQSNNGVRETNLLSMLFPIGLDYDRFDAAWLATMDSFGSLRGSFAHLTIKMQQPIDVKDKYETVKKQIVPVIKKLDGKISQLA